MRRTTLLLAILLYSKALFAQDVATVVEDSLYSPGVRSQMKFMAILPKNYYHTHERYTTIYLLHGFSGNHTDWIKYSGLVKYAAEYDFIIITPDGKNSWYTNSLDKKKNYEDYIINDLIPHVEKKYRTLGTRHGRVVAGLSMGGYGALKLVLKYPARFVFAGSFSGALYVPIGSRPDNKDISESLKEAFGQERSEQWTRNDPFALLDSVKTVSVLPYLYISTGKDDALARIVENNRKLVEKLQSRGVLYEYHETSGGHTWMYWDKELRNFLRRVSMFDPLNP
ncbi:MAG: alpha/beta hydrolase family protein [Bacteroidota bacterium]